MSVSLALPAASRAQQQELVVHADRSHLLLEELWPEMRSSRATLPPFLRDTALTVLLRNYYEDALPVRDPKRTAWALGGWLTYRSGWLLDAFQVGATYYGAGPVYPPLNKGDTLLLATGQSGYQVFGEAFAALRYEKYALLKGYRQEVTQPYVNRLDNRMTPNTFEGITLEGLLGDVEYTAGYLSKIKLRNADQFVSLSEAAGAPGSNYGAALLGLKVKSLSGLTIRLDDVYGVNTFNTFFVHAEHVWPLAHDARLQVGAQVTDQRAVGKALAYTTRVTKWSTRSGSARVALTWRDLTLKVAGSATTSGNKIRSPWGAYPGYLFLAAQQYNNANEKGWLAGVAYDFSRLIVPGLVAWADFVWAVDSIDPVKGVPLGKEGEYDLVFEYRPPFIQGLALRTRGLLNHQEYASRLGHVWRFIANWEIPLL